jgi:uncharacterized protein YjbI with pentapeptide repeats
MDEKSPSESAKGSDSASRRHVVEVWGPLTVSLLALLVSVYFTLHQLGESQDEFEHSSRDTHYNAIITGLGSPAAAVQTSSMRQLTEYVEDLSNYDGSRHDRSAGAFDAIQTLDAFIEDESTTVGFRGLHDYQSPEPIVLSRAATQLKELESNADLGKHIADISRANLHGIYLPSVVPTGNLIAEAADFRRATLSNLDLTQGLTDRQPDLTFAFFTCASLTSAHLGTANLAWADLTGADLRGADLSDVQGLTAAQVHGVTVGPFTKFPPPLDDTLRRIRAHPDLQWGIGSAQCNTLVNHMTGMQAGWGYLDTHPCPTSRHEAARLAFSPPFDGSRLDLVVACRLRAGRSVEHLLHHG